jgi:hypothetical protein
MCQALNGQRKNHSIGAPVATKRKVVPSVDPAKLTPSEGIGHDIVSRYSDLAPSVERILRSPMSEAGRLHAITLFRDSLTQPGDPMRHPAAAVAAGLALDGTTG